MPDIRITDLSWGGQGLGRLEGKVVFVPFSLPGEVAEIDLVYSKKNYSQGKLRRLLEVSPDRIEPPCVFYQKCGGCQLQHMAPDKQIREKERLFRQSLEHSLKDKEILIKPALISPLALGYRHRLQLKSSWKNNRFNLGFFRAETHDVVSIDHCLLANREVNAVLETLQEKIQSLPLQEWTPAIDLQFLGNPAKGGLVFTSNRRISKDQKKRITRELLADYPLNYLLFQESQQLDFRGQHTFSPEKDSPEFTLPAAETGLPKDLILSCFPLVFSQINLALNQQLIKELYHLNLFDSQETILDLYCGLGNFSLPLSFLVRDVIGLEVFPLAVANARWNQKHNRIANCTFGSAKAHEGIQQLRNRKITQVILDPPRTGAREVISSLDGWPLRGILYISCNPMTLFRDLIHLREKGWKVEWIQPIDFFPQTYHLESVTCLRKK
jgi:23S rRNA (uracil1939-C5)-methyltransferase